MAGGSDALTIAIIDTRPVITTALASWLAREGGFVITLATAPPVDWSGVSAPQVCLVGVAEGSWDWESLIANARSCWTQTPVVITLGAAPHRSLDAALELGIQGLVCEHGHARDLVAGLRAVARGERYICPTIAGRMAHGSAASNESRCSSLTAREREILRHLAGGQTKREIAADLHLSPKTIDNHTTAIMTKLNIHNRVGLTRFAIREGIFSA